MKMYLGNPLINTSFKLKIEEVEKMSRALDDLQEKNEEREKAALLAEKQRQVRIKSFPTE